MKYGFYRVACAAPRVTVADVSANCANIKSLVDEAASRGADAVVFPEMCVTGYTCADLFHSSRLLTGADAALGELAAHSASASGMLIAVGAPLRIGAALYNCAVLMADGDLLAVVPKTYIPNYNEFYEKRWFASSASLSPSVKSVNVAGRQVPLLACKPLEH